MSNSMDRRKVLAGASAAAVMALLRESYAASLPAAATGRLPGALDPGSRRAFSANQTITTLVPGRLYRVGCVVRTERLSWLAGDTDGFEPLNAYVLTDPDHCIFVDMGMPIALPAVQAALDTLVGERKVWVSYTRNEADCIGNMGYILGTCPDPTLLFGGAGGILEWINDPAVSMMEVRDFLGRIPIVGSKNGVRSDIGSFALNWFDAGYKQMLLTQWSFEASTGCLFTSDAFGFRHLADAESSPVVSSARNLPSVDAVARETVARMNWMRESSYPEVIERVGKIFRDNDVQIIAPVHGAVIKGREAVAAHVQLVLKALKAASGIVDQERTRYV
jgi:hypothetical protein